MESTSDYILRILILQLKIDGIFHPYPKTSNTDSSKFPSSIKLLPYSLTPSRPVLMLMVHLSHITWCICIFVVLFLHSLHVNQILNFQKDRGCNFSESLNLCKNFNNNKKEWHLCNYLTAQHNGQTQTWLLLVGSPAS